MKKFTALFLLLVFMLCGCNSLTSDQSQASKDQQTETNNSSVTSNNSSANNQQTNTSSSQNPTTGSNPNYTVSIPEPLVFDFSTKAKAQNPMSLEEVKAIFEPLIKEAVEIQETIINDCGDFELLKDPVLVVNKEPYYPIQDDQFKTINDVWDYVYTSYTKEAAQRIFSSRLDPNGLVPRFIEKDGKLYYERGAHGRDIRYSIETLNIIEQYEDTIIVSIDFTSFGDEIEKSVYVISNSEATWKMCNSENEAIFILPEQFLK